MFAEAALLRDHKGTHTRVRNLSRGGALLRHGEKVSPVRIGDTVDVVFLGVAFATSATVVRVNGWDLAVEFSEPVAEDVLQEWLVERGNPVRRERHGA